MLKIRILPCLDDKDGRVVKGINFEESSNALNEMKSKGVELL